MSIRVCYPSYCRKMLIASSMNTTCNVRSFSILVLTFLLLLLPAIRARSLSSPHSITDLEAVPDHDLQQRSDVASGSRSSSSGASSSSSGGGDEAAKPGVGSGTPRGVSVVIDIDFNQRLGDSFRTHTFVEFAGTATDGPFRVELATQQTSGGKFVGAVRGIDLTTAATDSGISLAERKGCMRKMYAYQLTPVTNAELMDSTTGKGLIWQTWMQDPKIRTGNGHDVRLSTGQTFVHKLLDTVFGAEHMKANPLPRGARSLMDAGDTYARHADPATSTKVTRFLLEKQVYEGTHAVAPHRLTFETNLFGVLRLIKSGSVLKADLFVTEPKTIGGISNLPQTLLSSSSDLRLARPRSAQALSPVTEVKGNSLSGSPKSSDGTFESAHSSPRSELEISVAEGRFPPSGMIDSDALAKEVQEASARDPAGVPRSGPGGSAAGQVATTEAIAVGRSAGKVWSIPLTRLSVLEGLGIVASVATIAFIIVDLVQGNYVGAAIGGTGIIAGVFAGAAVEAGVDAGLIAAGPIGWVVAGVVALVFAVLPFIFIHPKKKEPQRENVQQILQWVLFGDRDRTGNEKCGDGGNSTCQALYGPGIVSHAFGWDNFDGFAYLIEFNQGYAISIPDMAKTFQLVDPKVPIDSANGTALIQCPVDQKTCPKPKFILRRSRIRIPIIDDTADRIATRIIPAPGGDCKLVADPINGQHYPNYGFTVTGQPAAIACGIVESQVVAGVVIPMGPATGPHLNLTQDALSFNLPGNDSSGNGGDAYVAAPSIHPFRPLTPGDGLVCVASSTDGFNLCLSNGTYMPHNGDWGADITHADSLTMPLGAAIRWGKHHDIVDNATTADHWFHNEIRRFNSHKHDKLWISVPNRIPDVVCLYAEVEYSGNSACFANGGDMLPPAMRNQAKSVAVHGNAVAWIYADHYGDTGGTRISTNVPDLSSVAYGNSGNFSQNAVAMWVNIETPALKAKRSDSTSPPPLSQPTSIDPWS